MSPLSPVTVTALALLAAAICLVWAPAIALRQTRIAPWTLAAVAAALCAMLAGVLHWQGALALVALAVSARTAACTEADTAASTATGSGQRRLRMVVAVLTALLALALATHRLPGFDNPLLLRGVVLAADAAPFTQYANVDKGAAGLLLLALLCRRVHSWRELGAVIGRAWPLMLATLVAVFGLGVALGLVRPDVKFTALTWQFLAVNLWFTVVAEEAFFRGLLQERLTGALAGSASGAWWAVGMSAVLFGAVHLGGGPLLALMAGVAGLGYALVYQHTRRIEAAIVLHLLVNGVHFIFFTYPSLLKVHGV